MNPWLAAGLAAAALWFLRMNSSAQQQAQNAQAGTQAGAGQTSDQGGGSAFTPNSTIIPYQGGVTQPVSTVSYQPPSDGGDGGGGSGYGSGYGLGAAESGQVAGFSNTPPANSGYGLTAAQSGQVAGFSDESRLGHGAQL